MAKSLIFIIDFALLTVSTINVEDERGRDTDKGSSKGMANIIDHNACMHSDLNFPREQRMLSFIKEFNSYSGRMSFI